MTWSADQRSTHVIGSSPTGVDKPAEHPAKSVMARRWEQRRAEASARWLDQTASVVLERPDESGVSPTAKAFTSDVPAAQDVLEDLHVLELKTAAESGGRQSWLSNTQRAMLVVALVSNGVLLALLYAGGFLG